MRSLLLNNIIPYFLCFSIYLLKLPIRYQHHSPFPALRVRPRIWFITPCGSGLCPYFTCRYARGACPVVAYFLQYPYNCCSAAIQLFSGFIPLSIKDYAITRFRNKNPKFFYKIFSRISRSISFVPDGDLRQTHRSARTSLR